ncbi:Fpg/Nei family DNA glycosylase [Jiangella ureilytica]|uniref:DNA-(apurinic or apyrimidinic site) lyase n=1 Tax=Jiangella ureilytica TaxID=2530374 RepID=A0A4R4RWG0_9ACTN|nr:DNA-formamidopyrimidine glycosylase family protein [Jiangella ureilytica]TDC53232.1 Fpg/Nei family DNA glycosylase [Jiangella ureilytica]
MPEGHTIHRLAREMSELQGRALRASSPQRRFTDGAAAVDGAVLELAEAYGKHLFLHLSSSRSVHVHLGMQGKWIRSTDPSAPPLPQVRLRLAGDDVAWDLIAPSTCEILDPLGVAELMSRFGPDPLRPDADLTRVLRALARARGPIGAVLLDQTVIAGAGNVFRSEALHAVGVAPTRSARAMSESEVGDLWVVLRQMMSRAVEDGRIITVDEPDRLSLPESEARKVYKQERCRDCGAPVVTSKVGGRTAYHCPVEQPS